MYHQFWRVHFIGIGGSGMSGIAEVLLNLGYQVSGSDLESTEITRRLKSLGARIYRGHQPRHLQRSDVVVVSSAISENNPEILEAKRQHIPIIPRAQMLAELMRMKCGIAIAGTHGKTTTTSMVGSLLFSAGLDPTVVIGGRLNQWGTNAKLGAGKFLVAEADESDGSFHLLSPVISVVTNIDNDHLDHYKTFQNIKVAFTLFLNQLPFYGLGIVCGDDPNVRSILKDVNKRITTYGTSPGCDYRARHIQFQGFSTSFTVYAYGKKLGRFHIQVPGLHNVRNALAAVGVGRELLLSFQQIKKGLSAYGGVQRRFQVRGEVNGITVLDDYGHHPTEIAAVLTTCKRVWPTRRLVVAFQPHRFTRTQQLMKEFSRAFDGVDLLILTEIYPAGEKPIRGVSSEVLIKRLPKRARQDCLYVPKKQVLPELEKKVRRGDIVLTLGAGDIWKIGESFLETLRQFSK